MLVVILLHANYSVVIYTSGVIYMSYTHIELSNSEGASSTAIARQVATTAFSPCFTSPYLTCCCFGYLLIKMHAQLLAMRSLYICCVRCTYNSLVDHSADA